MTVLVYNDQTGRMERYSRELYEQMPHVTGNTLTVREFRGSSNSNIIWTDRRAMYAWNVTRSNFGRPIYVGYAFRRIGEGGHSNQSQHYAGTAFDAGQNAGDTVRAELRNLAASLGVWTYVEPAYLTPTWVHFDARSGAPACSAGYPQVQQGSMGVYVCVLQDCLGTLGIPGVEIDGIFGQATRDGVIAYQRQNGLGADGVVGCGTWTSLTSRANNLLRQGGAIPETYRNE